MLSFKFNSRSNCTIIMRLQAHERQIIFKQALHMGMGKARLAWTCDAGKLTPTKISYNTREIRHLGLMWSHIDNDY